MTARQLQTALAEDLKELFKNRRYFDPSGKRQSVSVYKQQLPKRQSDDEDDPFPYIVIRLDSGGIATQTDPHKVAVLLLVGIYDDSPENNGHEDVLEIMEVIQQHYENTPYIYTSVGGCRFTDPFNWVLQDEESYPYFFGACNMAFEIEAPRRKMSKFV